MRRLVSLTLLTMLATGCGAPSKSAVSNARVDSLLVELADSYPPDAPLGLYRKGNLGGLNLWAYCLGRGFPTVGYAKKVIKGPGAAIDNWACQRGAEQLAPVEPRVIDMTAACQWQYGRKDVVARAADPDHAWSWSCHGL